MGPDALVTIFNAGLVFMTCLLVVSLSVRTRLTDEARTHVALPLSLATAFWSLEYALQLRKIFEIPTWLLRLLPQDLDRVDDILNTLVSLGFGLTGWSLLRLRGRAHRILLPPAHSERRAWGIFGFAQTPGFLLALVLTILALLVVAMTYDAHRPSLIMMPLVSVIRGLSQVLLPVDFARSHPVEGVRVVSQAIAAGLGLLVLAAGLYRELTRARTDAVALVCCSSIAGYALLQLFQGAPVTEPVWYYVPRLSAIVFKVSFLVSLGSFWVVASETALASIDVSWAGAVVTRSQAVWQRLHDVGAQQAWSLNMRLNQVVERLSSENSDISMQVREIAQLAAKHDLELRHVLDTNRNVLDSPPPRFGLAVALAHRLEALEANRKAFQERMHTDLRLQPQPFPRLPAQVENALFLIAAEALRNVEKHAEDATHVLVELAQDASSVRLVIEDDGRGWGNSRDTSREHYGLDRIRTLAAPLQASVRFVDGAGCKGARVEIVCSTQGKETVEGT